MDDAKRAVVSVGDGRGFIVEADGRRLVVTAAHCLPHFPPAATISYTTERTYEDLVGPLAGGPLVWAECVFADPVADIAVLAEPDGQAFFDQAEAYEALTESVSAIEIAEAPPQGPGWLLTLDGASACCLVRHFGGPLWIDDAASPIMGGMSGSPIVDASGAAIGVVCCSGGSADQPQHTEGGPNPRLLDCLPGWLLLQLGVA